jgi:O-antigen/teichoic acid export membrane protein
LNKALKNVGSNWVVTLGGVAVNYIITPFLIRTCGTEGYGIYMLIMSMAGYLSLLVLGVPMASVRYFAEHLAKGDQEKLNETIGSCVGLYTMLGAVAVLIGAGLFFIFIRSYTISPAWQWDSRLAFALQVLYVGIGFVTFLPEGIMHAHQDFVIRNVILLSILVLRLVLTLAILRLVDSLAVLAAIQVVCLLTDFTVSYLVIKLRYRGLLFSFAKFRGAEVRRIFSFSLYVLLLYLGSRMFFYTSPIIIGAFMGISHIPFFSVANYFLVYLVEFVLGIAAVIMPAAARLMTQKRNSEVQEMFLKSSKILFALTLYGGLFLIVLGPRFIAWWISPSFEAPAGSVLQILVTSALIYLPARGVAQPVLVGLGRVEVPAVTCIAAGLINALLGALLIKPFGLPGLAMAVAIPLVLMSIIVLVYACRVLGVSLLTFLRYAVLRSSLGAVPVLALLMWLRNGWGVRSLEGLMGSFLMTALVFLAVGAFFVFRNDPYLDLFGQMRGLRLSRKPQ